VSSDVLQTPKVLAEITTRQLFDAIDSLRRDVAELRAEQGRTQLPKKYYTVKEIAAILSICDEGVRRLVKRGVLERSMAFRKILISAAHLEEFQKTLS